jgi:putative ABC transport system substrate-binding protein
LVLGNPDPTQFLRVLQQDLRELGYVDGQNIRFIVRSAEGRAERLPAAAAELVSAKVHVIVAYQTTPATAAKEATKDIPIVMAGPGDPVGTGLVKSFARPEGNITGVSAGAAEIAGKTVELIPQVLPQARRIAVLANETDPFTKPYLGQIRAAARALGLQVDPIMTRPGAALGPAFDLIAAKQPDALMTQGSLLRTEVVELALKHRLPSFMPNRSGPVAGALVSYSSNFDAMVRQSAVYVDKILKGAKPVDLPVTFPSKFDLVVNLKTARALGLTLSDSFLLRADEVME